MNLTTNSLLDVEQVEAATDRRPAPPITPNADLAAPGRRLARVLVADDAADTRVIVAKTLEFDGFQCIDAANGSEALSKARTYRPHLVILDLMLPEVSGFQVLMKLRNAENPPKVCVLSGIDKPEAVQRAIDLGASDYLVKPVLPDTLIYRVNSLLGRSTGTGFFQVKCDFVGSVVTQGKNSDVCQIEGISEVGVDVNMLNLPVQGEILRLYSPSLAKIVERDDPVLVRCRHVQPADGRVALDFVGLPESEVQAIRSVVIKGRYLADAMFAN